MKIIFPTNDDNGIDSLRSSHFGRARYYTLVNTSKNGMYEVSCVENIQGKEHSCGSSAKSILSQNADALVIKGIGAKPAKIFADKSLNVFVDSNSATVKESLQLLLSDSLASISNDDLCKSHAH